MFNGQKEISLPGVNLTLFAYQMWPSKVNGVIVTFAVLEPSIVNEAGLVVETVNGSNVKVFVAKLIILK